MSKDLTVGLDLGDRYSHFCVLDDAGQIVEEGRVPTTTLALRRKFSALGQAMIALEVCVHSPWVSRLLAELGLRVFVAHAAKVPLIYQTMKKRDRVDAERLARLARVDPELLSPIVHRGPQAQQDLQVIRSREVLVEMRTKLVNHVRSTVKTHGHRLAGCSARAFHKRVQEELPPELRGVLEPILATLGEITQRINAYDKHIEQLAAESYPEVEVLRQVSGVGPLTALTFVLTLERPERFSKSRDVGAYLGLTPKQDQSGECDKQLRITKAGNRYLRKLLVGSAHYILGPFGPECALRQWGQAKACGGRNAKKRAVVAVARKLAVLLHRLWNTREVYEPFYEAAA